MIKEPLFQLADFIQKNLSPNRLEGFDIDQLKDLRDFEEENIIGQNIIINDGKSHANN